MVISKTIEKVKRLKSKTTIRKSEPILKDPVVLDNLTSLQKRFVIVPIDKASNNFAFVCKKYYVARLMKEVGIPDNSTPTYQLANRNKESIIQNNIEFCERYSLKVPDDNKILPIMYWIPKMHKNPIGTRFIVASSKCSTKPLSKGVSRAFKLIFDQIQNFHEKSTFYSNYKKFWVVENSFPIIQKLNKINEKKNAKCISAFDFSTLYTKIEHDTLLKNLFSIIDFVFSGGNKKAIAFTTNSAYWTNNLKTSNHFTKTSLKNALRLLILESYFTIGNVVLLQTIGIPMGIDPAPFWANLHLYKYESEYITKLIHTDKAKARKYHGAHRFIDDQCCINDSGDFGNSYQEIYPNELELKVEHNGNHATFLDLDITIQDGVFIYKLYDKRDAFPFFIVRMPHMRSNIPSFIFYGSFYSEILRIARCTLLFADFLPRASILLNRMIAQGGSISFLMRNIKKAYMKHTESFRNFNKTCEQLLSSLSELSNQK